jgi:site-specific DNA recombinase
MSEGRPWLTYQRVSTEDQAREGVSLDAQREACRHLAAAARYEIAADLVDPGYSAKDLKRPGMQRLLELVHQRAIAGVIIYKLDRLTRSMRDLLDLLKIFETYEVALVSVSERLDTASPMGRFVIGLIGLVAEWERETIAERVSVGMHHRMAQGGYVGGRVPAGLRVVGEAGKRMLEADPVHGPAVAQIWHQVAAGKSLREVALALQRAGVPSQGRDGWTITALHKMIQSDRYVGLLVSAEDQARALAALGGRSCPARRGSAQGARGPSAKAMRTWLLTGIAKCSKCGSALVGVSATSATTRSYHYYQCTGRIRKGKEVCSAKDLSADRWEPAVIDAFVRLVRKDGNLERDLVEVRQRLEAAAAPVTEERRGLVMDLDRLQAEIDRLVGLAASGAAVADAVAKGLAERQERAEGLRKRIAGLDGRLAVAAMNADQIEAMVRRLRQDVEALPGKPPEIQAATLRMFLRSVVLKPHRSKKDKGEIDLSIDLPSLVAPAFVSPSPMVDLGALDTNALCFSLAVSTRLAG